MSRQEKHNKRRSLTEAVRRWMISEGGELVKSKPAKASDYLYYLADYHKKHPNVQAVIYCRVSAGMQGYNGNLDTYKKLLRRKLKRRNIPVIGCWREISSGWILNEDRYALVNAIEKAKKHKAVVVAASSDRFLRNRDFHTKERPDILPTIADFEQLKKMTGDVPLLTLLDPDMPPKEVRICQTKWGQRAKGNKGGRPRDKVPGYKKRERLQKLDRVIRLYKKGKKTSVIAYKTGLKPDRIRVWIKRYG